MCEDPARGAFPVRGHGNKEEGAKAPGPACGPAQQLVRASKPG